MVNFRNYINISCISTEILFLIFGRPLFNILTKYQCNIIYEKSATNKLCEINKKNLDIFTVGILS